MTNEQIITEVEKAVENSRTWSTGYSHIQNAEKANGKRYHKTVDLRTGKKEYSIEQWNAKKYQFETIAYLNA